MQEEKYEGVEGISSGNDSQDNIDNSKYNEQFYHDDIADKSTYKAFEFRANPKEYFKIWIVNVALTILTLGIYSAWAKVRTNRYIYASTFLNGSNFEYNANPKRILIGRLIVVSAYGLFVLFSDYLNMYKVAAGIVVVFLLLLPWLIRQAIRFRLKSTSYRNIHFKYKGKVKSFYGLFILAIFLFIIPGALVAAFAKYRVNFDAISVLYPIYLFVLSAFVYKKFQMLLVNNSYFGKDRFNANLSTRSIMWLFLAIWAWTMIGGVLIALIILFGGSIVEVFVGKIDHSNPYTEYIVMAFVAVIYLMVLGLYKGISDAYFSNYIRNNTTLGSAKLKGTMEPFSLGWISATNTLMLVLSLGLLYPWTRVRYLKYKLENTHFSCQNYDKFIADSKDDISTYGEETLDFFDIDIGV